MSRADKILPTEKIPTYYSDFPMNMDKNLVTGQLARITNAEAVKQAIANLVLTSTKEQPYQPYLGSQIRQSLFDNIDDEVVVDNIKDSIKNCIKGNDMRAEVLKVTVQESTERNGYNVEIWFSILNITEPEWPPYF